jgi:hypothetical protein
MARPADALPDPFIVVIDDELGHTSNDEAARSVEALLAEIASGPIVDLADVEIADVIREERADRGA